MAGNPVAAWDGVGRQPPAAVGVLPPVAPVVGRAEAKAAGRRRLRAVTVVRFALATQPPAFLANACQVLGKVGMKLQEHGRAARAQAWATEHGRTDVAIGHADRRHQTKRQVEAAWPTSNRAGGHGR